MAQRIGTELTIELDLRGPILVTSSEVGPWGVDAVAMRDPAGRLVVPGDSVQGLVREAFEDLGGDLFAPDRPRSRDIADSTKLPAAHGDVFQQAKAREAAYRKNLEAETKRYGLFFSDFVAAAHCPPPGAATLSQTRVDPATGAAEEGSLRVLDCPVAPGQVITFAGVVRFFAPNETAADEMTDKILQAFCWIPSFGGQKSVGFGRNMGKGGLPQLRLKDKSLHYFGSRRRMVPPTTICEVGLTFADPICVPAGVANGNIYESRDEIPGEVLRGGLAELLRRIDDREGHNYDLSEASPHHPFIELCQNFSRLRITTARPANASPTPAAAPSVRVPVVPLSVCVAGGRWFDAALQADTNRLFDGRAADFAPNWKTPDERRVGEYFRQAVLERELRVRTAIESRYRRAKMHSLFAYRTVRPEKRIWCGTVAIDPRAGPHGDRLDPQQSHQLLEQAVTLLGSGWMSIGKTRSRCTSAVANAVVGFPPVSPFELGRDLVFVVTLRAATLMLDPREFRAPNDLPTEPELDVWYAQYWDRASDGLLSELPERRFKRDLLVGGFQARRYRYAPHQELDITKESNVEARQRRQKTFPYNPSLLADTGSVFVLKLTDIHQKAAAHAKITEWQTYGLPLPDWARKAYGDTYHTNIFLPQNGFGEIDVNLPCHQSTFENPLFVDKQQ